MSPAGDNVVATAGADGDVHLFDRSAERVLATLQGHSKKVNGACRRRRPRNSSLFHSARHASEPQLMFMSKADRWTVHTLAQPMICSLSS